MYAGGLFGDLLYADLPTLTTGPRPRVGGGVGGSGFPRNWADVLAENAAEERRQKRRLAEEEELLMLVSFGLL